LVQNSGALDQLHLPLVKKRKLCFTVCLQQHKIVLPKTLCTVCLQQHKSLMTFKAFLGYEGGGRAQSWYLSILQF